MKQKITSEGFTLIEILVSMMIIAVIGSVALSIFFSVLRGSQKASALIKVRQNGNYAISQISKLVRDAKSLDNQATCSAGPSAIVFTGQDDLQHTLSCSGTTITYDTTSLTDTSTVQVTNCSFSCSQGATSPVPVVSVSFMVNQIGTPDASERRASILFETSTSLRNIK